MRPLRHLIVAAIATAIVASTSAATLIDLREAGDLRARFNQDRGRTRLVLLVSPT